MSEKKNINNIFLVFLILHISIWTLVPSLTNINLPLDTIEALAWGSNLDWGFNKHPPLSACIVEIFYQILAILYHISEFCAPLNSIFLQHGEEKMVK